MPETTPLSDRETLAETLRRIERLARDGHGVSPADPPPPSVEDAWQRLAEGGAVAPAGKE